jgi:hypothetical protein
MKYEEEPQFTKPSEMQMKEFRGSSIPLSKKVIIDGKTGEVMPGDEFVYDADDRSRKSDGLGSKHDISETLKFFEALKRTQGFHMSDVKVNNEDGKIIEDGKTSPFSQNSFNEGVGLIFRDIWTKDEDDHGDYSELLRRLDIDKE